MVTPFAFFSGVLFVGSFGWKPGDGLTGVASLPPAYLKMRAKAPAARTSTPNHSMKRLKRADERAV